MVSYSPSGGRKGVSVSTSSMRSSPDTCQPLRISTTSGVSSSCSSRTSPTISSIRSSRVTMPAVPPYSSTTSAVCSPLARSCVITASPSRVDGTVGAGWTRDASLVMRPVCSRYLEDLLDVHDPDRFVEVAVDDREAGVAGFRCLFHQVGDGVVGLQHLDLRTRRHQLLGGAGAEPQRTVDQRGGSEIERSTPGRIPYQRDQFLRRARRPQLFGRFDAQSSQDPVGSSVGQLDQRGGGDREQQLWSGDDARRREWLCDSEVLRHEFAEHHRRRGGDQQRHAPARDRLRRLWSATARRTPVSVAARAAARPGSR